MRIVALLWIGVRDCVGSEEALCLYCRTRILVLSVLLSCIRSVLIRMFLTLLRYEGVISMWCIFGSKSRTEGTICLNGDG